MIVFFITIGIVICVLMSIACAYVQVYIEDKQMDDLAFAVVCFIFALFLGVLVRGGCVRYYSKCPECGTIRHDTSYCVNCGYCYEEAYNSCSNCNKSYGDKDRFCPHCGNEVNPELMEEEL